MSKRVPKKCCPVPGCIETIPIGTRACEKHKPEINKERFSDIGQKLYKSSRWIKLSKRYRKNFPWCKSCLDKGIRTPCALVDHIIPVKEGGDMFNTDNLQPLCVKCHAEKTSKDRSIYG